VKLWWLSDFARFGSEKAAVEKLTTDEEWFALQRWNINAFRFSAEGVITAHGVGYPVRLIYPDQFPSVPAWVEPQDLNVRWSSHQYGTGGSLCLELRPDNWTPQASGADVLRSAYNLLRAENPLGEGDYERAPSAHRVGDVQSYDWGQEPVLIGASCLDRLKAGTAEGISALRWHTDDDVWPILVFDAMDRTQPQHPPSFDLGTLRIELPVIVGRMEPPSLPPKDRATLAMALGVKIDPECHKGALVAIAVGADEVIPYHSPNAESLFARKWVILPEQAGLRSGRRQISAVVAIVGAGSVGSKIAEMLVRSGIQRFLLVDGDVMLPANLERHTLDWRDVGFRKAYAVRRRLLHIVPGASVDVIAENLNWQRSARMHADQIERLANCDLIIDATGDVATSLMLGAVAAENGKPFVSVEVFEGGIGCLVARSIPGRDPAYISGRAAYSAFCDQQDVDPPRAGHRTYEALTEAGEPFVADDAAVAIAASHAARVALDVLDNQVSLADTAWLLVGARTGWLFTRHGHTISLDVGPASASPPTTDDQEARQFALSLAKEALNANKAAQ
jgi:molybdopterin/thiamine biosynthesis adenylyltransferase